MIQYPVPWYVYRCSWQQLPSRRARRVPVIPARKPRIFQRDSKKFKNLSPWMPNVALFTQLNSFAIIQ